MKKIKTILIFVCILLSVDIQASQEKHKILIVDSYHREYLWSQDTSNGAIDALLKYKFLDNIEQGDYLSQNDWVESSKSIIKKIWMNTKIKNTRSDISKAVSDTVFVIEEFKPDIVLLGDDNAANYIGNQYLDTELPIVFWGINGLPTKYDLIDSVEKPGHNVTGVYQSGYLKESLYYLNKLVPG